MTLSTGQIITYSAVHGFGVIHSDDGVNLGFSTAMLPEPVIAELAVGAKVQFSTSQGRSGNKAVDIKLQNEQA